MAAPLINGVAYGFAQLTVNIMGNDVVGITAVKYEDAQDIENQYGAGNKPVSRGFGQIKFTGSLTLEAAEVHALEAAAPNGRLQEIPAFDVTLVWEANATVVTKTLKQCVFKSNSRDVKTGDLRMEIELPLEIGDIVHA